MAFKRAGVPFANLRTIASNANALAKAIGALGREGLPLKIHNDSGKNGVNEVFADGHQNQIPAALFLKRDNGSPFNCQSVADVMARFGVLPLNNPPHFPRYNGAQEKGIRDLKAALDQRQQHTGNVPKDLALAVEVTAHELNHRSRRCLKGRTACAVWNDGNQHLRWTHRQRQTIFRLLLTQFGAIVGKTTNGRQLKPATAWRVTVETWLRCQGLITVHQNQKPNVSTTFQKIWSYN